MIGVKRIELVVEAIEKQEVISRLESINIRSFTLYQHVGGYGERGIPDAGAFGEKFENVTFVIACSENHLQTVIEALRPILKRYGGMCLVSDAKWILH
ncbi:P-II family nitrogen regulator [Methylophilus aquaticus]|uniref:Transcriptional regulator n=1 Tax=Methylophilus aquaticus TaxID=1971610 RepID=A0ABT9JU46_9PROT|nr:transcriptional regulator [Methylophilus aquaticus]MDP8568054.1 transcriptional regulator [Methylophilus aquaticus]